MVTREEVKSVSTRDQKHKAKAWDRMFISRSLITSPAFLSLRRVASPKVLLLFMTKCVMDKPQHKPRSKREYVIANNGKIQFSYLEAQDTWGILRQAFRDAIDELIEHGFIDIEKQGNGIHKDCSLYSISDRWKDYGTPEFVVKSRPRRESHYGFCKGNKRGQNKLNSDIHT